MIHLIRISRLVIAISNSWAAERQHNMHNCACRVVVSLALTLCLVLLMTIWTSTQQSDNVSQRKYATLVPW